MSDPDATREASMYGWHHTGDLGYRDAGGYYYIVDRAKDMIISGGYNIFPSEIEQIIWSHEGVRDCAVVGIPGWGEAVTAVVELKAQRERLRRGTPTALPCRLGPLKAPKHVEFWLELPRSAVGKVLKSQIRERFWATSPVAAHAQGLQMTNVYVAGVGMTRASVVSRHRTSSR